MVNPPVSGLAAATRRELAATLNQAARRLRNFESEQQWSRELVNVTEEFCERAALFAVNSQTLELRAARNLETGAIGPVPLGSAAAFASVVESRDTLVAMRTAGELSRAFASITGENPGGRFFLFPLIVRERVTAILYADSDQGHVESSALELIAGIGASVLTALPPDRRDSQLHQIC